MQSISSNSFFFYFWLMWLISVKEWRQFFSSLSGYMAISVFLLLTGLLLFVYPDTSLLEFGYASLNGYFSLAPWVLMFLVPTITMRSFSEEYKAGTFELLSTMPVTPFKLVLGKFFGSLLIVLLALIPTVLYAISLQTLSAAGGLDIGSTVGSYIGLLFLGAVFTSVGICCSSYTDNTIIAFITGAFSCFLFFTGFHALSMLPVFPSGFAYFIENLGLDFHYNSISKGVIDTRDLLYFSGIVALFLWLTKKKISQQ